MTSTFKVTTINVSTNAPELVLLSGREYSRQYTALPNANLPKAMRENLAVVFNYLSGEELPAEDNTFLIKSDNGVYSRLFGPVLKAGQDEVDGTKTGELYIQWGSKFIPIGAEKGKFTRPDGTEIEAEFGQFNFSGRGEDPAIFISADDPQGDGQVVLPVAVRFVDWKNPPDAKSMGVMLKKAPEQIATVVQPVATRGSNSDNSSDRVTATQEVEFRSLEVDTPYQVISYYPCKTKFGLTYKILIQDYPEVGEIGAAWAHSTIKPLLATKPEINREKPALLTVKSKEQTEEGKWKIRANLLLSMAEEVDESELNLNFGN
jgi:hypothetical protein